MIVLERSEEFHQHVEACDLCTAGARDSIFCQHGYALMLSAAAEAILLKEASEESDRKMRSAAIAAKQRERKEIKTRTNGVTAAAERLRGRVPSDSDSAGEKLEA